MKITYLFGAGASRNCLPIVNEMPDRIQLIRNFLNREEYQLSDKETYSNLKSKLTKFEIGKMFIEDLDWLIANARKHASIDTLAKKLFIKGQYKDLDKLKAVFSVYMIIEQYLNKPDIRYDSFFASILNDAYYKFPDNLRILSWNYDMQFEIALSEYTDHKEIEINSTFLNVISKYSFQECRNEKFGIFKLNGSTILLKDQGFRQYHFYNGIEEEITSPTFELLLANYALLRIEESTGIFSGISFAWEKFGKDSNDIVLKSKSETANTEILIVIGYSFPYFNREIDRDIIGNMKNLRKVYFQAPDAESLKERFLSIRGDLGPESLLSRFDCGQFLLPNEL